MHKNLVTCNKSFFSRVLKTFGNLSKYSNVTKERQINIEGQTINYVKHGHGNHTILCFPGAMGSIWTDFRPQVEGLDTNKFTIVAWDPPGYGHSRPPKRKYLKDFYHTDADMAKKFMEAIGINKYSLLGWSDGGLSSMILSAKYPNSVNNLVVWGCNPTYLPFDIAACENVRDINAWSEKMKTPFVKVYGEEEFQRLCNDWVDILQEIVKDGGNVCNDLLSSIQCRTLILHGNKDAMIAKEHPEHLLKSIKNAKLHRFPEGKHNIHLRYPDEFNAIVTRFLEENPSKL